MYVCVGGPPVDWRQYRILDPRTNKEIPNVIWADDETNEYVILVKNPTSGKPFVHPSTGVLMKSKKTGNFKIVRRNANAQPIQPKVLP